MYLCVDRKVVICLSAYVFCPCTITSSVVESCISLSSYLETFGENSASPCTGVSMGRRLQYFRSENKLLHLTGTLDRKNSQGWFLIESLPDQKTPSWGSPLIKQQLLGMRGPQQPPNHLHRNFFAKTQAWALNNLSPDANLLNRDWHPLGS